MNTRVLESASERDSLFPDGVSVSYTTPPCRLTMARGFTDSY